MFHLNRDVVVEEMTSRLGAFTPENKATLDALRLAMKEAGEDTISTIELAYVIDRLGRSK